MNYLIAVVCLAAVALARPGPGEEAPEPLPFQYTSTSEVDGSYFFSYAAEDSSKTETRLPNGSIIGGYQYVDSDGVLQKVQYQAGEDGVQILASNLPVGSTEPVVDTPEVLKAKEEHFHAVQKAIMLVARAQQLAQEYKAKMVARVAAEKAARLSL